MGPGAACCNTCPYCRVATLQLPHLLPSTNLKWFWDIQTRKSALGRKYEILSGAGRSDRRHVTSLEAQSEGWSRDSSVHLCGHSTVKKNACTHSCWTHECAGRGLNHTCTDTHTLSTSESILLHNNKCILTFKKWNELEFNIVYIAIVSVPSQEPLNYSKYFRLNNFISIINL